MRGENTPERKFASTEDRTHNHQVMCPTHSPLSHPGGAPERKGHTTRNTYVKDESLIHSHSKVVVNTEVFVKRQTGQKLHTPI